MNIESVVFQNGGADNEANALREQILGAGDPRINCYTVYYVSQNGDDNNDGLSPQTAIKSFLKLKDLPLKADDAVLFERGSLFRTADKVDLVDGVYYGAYGEGDKPRIVGSLRDYADPSIWEREQDSPIWRTEIKDTEIAGMINFDFDKYIGVWQDKKEDLLKDGDFYHDNKNGVLYLYFSDGNPGEVFTNIEIATTPFIFWGGPSENIIVQNLCFKYATFGPFRISDARNVRITECEMGWHGGRVFSRQDNGVIRYGNAVELWYRALNTSVDHCYIYQVFDAAVTFQGQHTDQSRFVNVRFENNLIEYCSMNIEYWAGRGGDGTLPHISDISIKGNIIRFAGYGWGGLQRLNKDGQGMLLGWDYWFNDMSNFVITENILDCADCYMIHQKLPDVQKGLIVHKNTYIQKKTSGLHDFVQVVKGIDIVAHNVEELKKAILKFDSSPECVRWISE